MAAKLKGNLGLKSSPLAPTACKLSTQYLVLDHMTNHYNKIAKAKPAIDSKPPKSLSTSQKLRDRRNREKIVHSPRPRAVTSMSHDGFQTYQDVLNDEPEDDEEKLVHSIMKSTLLGKSHSTSAVRESYDADVKNLYQHQQGGRDSRYSYTYSARPGSARSIQSGHSLGPSASRLPMSSSSHDPTKITYQGDVLEKRPYLFTEPERPFTPRTLKNNHQSRLKSSKCYNPPPVKSSLQTKLHADKHPQPAPEVRLAPRPRPRSNSKRLQQERDADGYLLEQDSHGRRRDSFHGLGETMETTGQLSESMLMDITLQSRDGRHFQPQKHEARGGQDGQNVPPLAISMDQDHMNWLQEQASKAQVRARNRDQLRSSSLHSDDDALRPTTAEAEQNLPHNGPGLRESIKRETMKKEEDQKYLAFAKEVTDDVLSRGICTDSVLNRVFENHIERKKEQLDVGRMREVIQDLRRDLGLRDSSAERTPHAALSDANYNNRSLTAPVTVETNGEEGNGSSNQLPSSSSKGTTVSTSAKDDTSSTLSPANHFEGEKNKINNGNSTSLEPLHVMSSPSDNGGLTSSATLESVSSFKFGQTGDMVDTITSEAILEDSAREREEEEAGREDESDELTATQALKQYEFDLTVKEGTAEQSATTGTSSREESEGTAHSNSNRKEQIVASRRSKLERPATGERRKEPEANGEETKSESANERGGEGAELVGNNHRSRRREEHRLRKAKASENLSSQNSSLEESEKIKSSSGGSFRKDEAVSVPVASARSSEYSATGTASTGQGFDNSQASENSKHAPGDADDDVTSVKSSASSQRPAVRPRTRTKLEQARQGPSQSQVDSMSDRTESTAPETRGKDQQQSSHPKEEQVTDGYYEDDYEEDEDVDESTHRTSDDDF
ncbi:spermatogenesis-associated protein 7 [Plakobranchus ocellatus]|uniref:Spermatogenesis-associated protein 7 n=1 Tax=Plakobranchus ocellatus TaxID=259542 RepID=A0AAV3Y6G0_9GAST|nr:spermatogenesis-associated protein 7 [Plakobranchus ocellatus]